MNQHFEKEFKILLSKEQFTALLKQFPQAEFKKQINTYYDTADLLIRKQVGAMRIREIDNSFIFTLKQRCQDGAQEHECVVTENSPEAFKSGELHSLLTSLHIEQPIIKIASLTTYRALIQLTDAELCFDYNEYNGIVDYEIEYEFIRPHDGITAFNQLLSIIDVKYEKNCISKIQRAFLSRNTNA